MGPMDAWWSRAVAWFVIPGVMAYYVPVGISDWLGGDNKVVAASFTSVTCVAMFGIFGFAIVLEGFSWDIASGLVQSASVAIGGVMATIEAT